MLFQVLFEEAFSIKLIWIPIVRWDKALSRTASWRTGWSHFCIHDPPHIGESHLLMFCFRKQVLSKSTRITIVRWDMALSRSTSWQAQKTSSPLVKMFSQVLLKKTFSIKSTWIAFVRWDMALSRTLLDGLKKLPLVPDDYFSRFLM